MSTFQPGNLTVWGNEGVNIHRNHKDYYGRKESGEGGKQVGKEGPIYLSLHCHHHNDSCIQIGTDESHSNSSFIVRDTVRRQCPTNHKLFEDKGEPKRNRAEALLLSCLTPYRWAKPAPQSRLVT